MLYQMSFVAIINWCDSDYFLIVSSSPLLYNFFLPSVFYFLLYLYIFYSPGDSVLPFFLAKLISDMTNNILLPMIYGIITYWYVYYICIILNECHLQNIGCYCISLVSFFYCLNILNCFPSYTILY